jgi:hypothetical protein
MPINISFSDKTVRVAVELNGEIESAITELPKREWFDLTREQFAEILCDDRWQFRPELMMLQVQAKLKEKNG